MNFSPLVLLVSILLISSCGEVSGKKNRSGAQNTMRKVPSTKKNLFSIAPSLAPKCPYSSCLGSVVSVISSFEGEGEKSTCTGFFVSENQVMTNAHCLPEELEEGSSCEQEVVIIESEAYQNDKSPKAFKCSKIIARSQSGGEGINLDYALIEIKGKTSRRPLEISNEGVSDGEAYTLWKLDYDKSLSLTGSTLKKEKCRGLHNTYIYPQINNRKSKNFIMTDCYAQGGNSGSALLSSDGKVAGILSATINQDGQRRYLQKYNIIADDFILGTSGRCLPFENKKLPKECSVNFSSKEIGLLQSQYEGEVINERFPEILDSYKERYFSGQWSFRTSAPGMFFPVAECVEASEVESLMDKHGENIRVRMSLYQFKTKINSDFKFEVVEKMPYKSKVYKRDYDIHDDGLINLGTHELLSCSF